MLNSIKTTQQVQEKIMDLADARVDPRRRRGSVKLSGHRWKERTNRLASIFKKAGALYLSIMALAINSRPGPYSFQVNQIAIGKNVQVSASNGERPHVEPIITVDPMDPKHFVAASIAFTRPDNSFTCTVFISFDGGSSWQNRRLNSLDGLAPNFAVDPWVAFGTEGKVFLSCVADNGKTASLLVFRSDDGGRTWLKPAAVPFGGGGSFDRDSIIVDTTNSKYSGRIYATASQGVKIAPNKGIAQPAIAWSSDGGQTFSAPVRLAANNLETNVSNMAVLSDGTLVVSFMDFMDSSSRPLKTRRIWVATSRDGGQTLSVPSFVAEFQVPDAEADAYYGPNFTLAASPSSGAFGNRLYMVWNDFRAGDADIWVSYSSDQGGAWSKPVRVNDNANKGIHHSTPVIAVSPKGMIGVTWYDRRADPRNKCSEMYFSASIDGGASFLPNIRISPVKFCPDVPGNTVHASKGDSFGVGARWPAGGDYSGLAAGADDLFRALWSDSRTGVYQLWTASIKVGSN